MTEHEINEPCFISEEMAADMIAAGYVFDVPRLITLPHDYNKLLELDKKNEDPAV